MKDRTMYVVAGSEDGVLGVCTSPKRAAAMALDYVTANHPGVYWTADAAKKLASDVRRNNVGFTSTADVRGLASCSGSVSADVTAYTVNYSCGRDY